MPLLLSGAVTATAALALGFTGCNTSSSDPSGEGCVSTPEFFAKQVMFRTFAVKCVACHNATGEAKDTQFVLHSSAEAGYLEANLEIVRGLAQTEKNGESVLLQKPLGKLDHGGGVQLDAGSAEYADLKTLVDKINADDTCPTNSAEFFAGAQLAGPENTLRKAALVLAARLPTDEESAAVKAKGFDALPAILDQYMSEEAYYNRIRESYNDRFFTDFYMSGNNDPLDLIQPDPDDPATQYYSPTWYDAITNTQDGNCDQASATEADIVKYGAQDPSSLCDMLHDYTRQAVAQEPLELIAYIVRNNKPFTEVLTADYTVVNPFSAKAYGVTTVQFTNDADRYEFHEAKVADGTAFPQAGVLTMPVWLTRHPTTATNRNRHRARMVFQDWLGTDVLKVAERPLDPTKITDFNPTMNSAACAVCHGIIDPLAGAFQNFQNEQGSQSKYSAAPLNGNGWYLDMRPPGFGKEKLPSDQYTNSLHWLGEEVTNDPRFAVSVTYQAFRMITGEEPLIAPSDPSSPSFNDDVAAYLGEYYTLSSIAQKFKASNYNFKVLTKEIVMSPYFRAENTAADINPAQLKKFGPLGTAHLLTPEQLNRKLSSILGMDWRGSYDSRFFLLSENEYRLLYGGIDSENVTKRISDPNGIMANVQERMANEMSCSWVPSEFALAQKDRKFFTEVEKTVEPEDLNGYEVPSAKTAILAQIVKLHDRFLGERLDANDPEIQRTYQLFLETWREGKSAIAKKDPMVAVGENLDGQCTPDQNYLTGSYLPSGDGSPDYGQDKYYTIRAWMAVTTYLITDYKFLYE